MTSTKLGNLATIVTSTDSPLTNIIMQETKFILHGQFHRPNGWIMNDSLGYIKETKEDAIATCKRLNPNFVIHTITTEN